MAKTFGDNIVTQVGLVVRDIEKSLDRYMDIFGLETRPGVNITDMVDKANTTYHGQPSSARAKLAFIQAGQVTIELIEPVGGPSTWQEFLDMHGEGVHHIAFNIQGTEKVVSFLQSRDILVAQRGDYTGGQYTYVDSAPQLGVILELLEDF